MPGRPDRFTLAAGEVHRVLTLEGNLVPVPTAVRRLVQARVRAEQDVRGIAGCDKQRVVVPRIREPAG